MPRKKLTIISCCVDDWGGSEELWARAIPVLQAAGCAIRLCKVSINPDHPEIRKLKASGVELQPLVPTVRQRAIHLSKRVMSRYVHPSPSANPRSEDIYGMLFKNELKRTRPDLVIIAQGINFDGMAYARVCQLLMIPYVLIVQKAVAFYWPPEHDRAEFKQLFLAARRCYFVSQHNLALTEEQLGMRLERATIVRNPIRISPHPIPYPDMTNGVRIACVARLFIIDKGQDMLLRIMSEARWRNRPISLSLFGTGSDRNALVELATLLGVDKLSFQGHVNDVEEIWRSHHALVLPSRSEGMALSLLEAMAAGRPVLATRAGGHTEIVKQNYNGFICDATEPAIADMIECAWEVRDQWDNIGRRAAETISQYIAEMPEERWTESILNILFNQNRAY